MLSSHQHRKNALSDNGETAQFLGSSNSLLASGSMLTHNEIHKGTWQSPDGATMNGIHRLAFLDEGSQQYMTYESIMVLILPP